MSGTKFSSRTIWLLLADIAIIYGGIMLALYLRLGVTGSEFQLNENNGWYKIAFATSICLLIIYFYDLYDYTIIANRRELFLRLVQSLGIAWAILAFIFYLIPPLLIGRGVSVYSVIIVIGALLIWRVLIHYLTGHPDIGEKILIVGSGKTALETAEVAWDRRDAGFRIMGFISENGHKPQQKLGQSEIVGTTQDLENIIKAGTFIAW